ncbi:MAG TPA: hypothetical protein VFV02_08640 [Acidimicrobiales bacterium]|nr:hypothetical protein [Acidimicrobiales bacterium]
MPFSQANFNGYATGDELHLGLPVVDQLLGSTGVSVSSIDQALSSASTSTAGLTSGLNSELGTLIQPPQAAGVKAFNLGQGLSLDLGQIGSTVNSVLTNLKQSLLPAVSFAPPDLPASITSLLQLPLDPILNAGVIQGEAKAAWPGTSCPTGNLSYGLGNLASASVLTGLPAIGSIPGLSSAGVSTAPLLSTAGSGGQAVAQTKSLTDLVSNGSDGTYGIQTQAQDIIAPLSVNLAGIATLNVGVHSANGNLDPVTLTATTSGENSVPASLNLSTDDILDVTVTALGQTVSLVHLPLSTIGQHDYPLTLTGLVNGLAGLDVPSVLISTLNQVISGLNQLASSTPVSNAIQTITGLIQNQLTPVLGQVGTTVSNAITQVVQTPTVQQLLNVIQGTVNLSLGDLRVDTQPHAIGNPNAPSVASADGTHASGALDLLNLHLGLQGSSINIGGQTIPAGTIPGVSQAIAIPPILNIPLSSALTDKIANPVLGHLEAASTLNSPIACTVAATTTPPVQQVGPTPTPTPTVAPKLPFTGGPGGLWQPVTGVGFLGVGGGTLALLRRLRKRSAV